MIEWLSAFFVALAGVFMVVDPIGVVPIFLGMTVNDTPAKMRDIALRACIVGGSLLLFFAIFGGVIFKIFGVSLSGFRVAGGIVLLITALDMLRARSSPTRTSPAEEEESLHKEDVAIVPLAMPLLGGPGAIAAVMVLMSRGSGAAGVASVVLAIVITFVVTYFLLRGATLVQRVLGKSGVAILERVMGLILAAIAVQFIAEGARDLMFRPPAG
jgi:multiple antibiotic resistance protein